MRIVLVVLLSLISIQLHSQYPKKVVVGSDTAVVISRDQLTLMNLKLAELDEYKAKVNSLEMIRSTYEKKDSLMRDNIVALESEVDLMKYNESLYESSISYLRKKVDDSEKSKKKYLIIGGIGVTVGVGGLIALLVK